MKTTGYNSGEAISTSAMEGLQVEFDAFRESSFQLEKELEEELSRMEKRARSSEEELKRAREDVRESTARLVRQLLDCQRELAQVREEKCDAMQMVRDKEEALEQAAENERRATAEVESLRQSLDDSMEVAAFAQTELEDSKSTIEEQTKHLYQELEEAHAELALLTSGKGDSPVSIGSHGSGSGSDSGNGRREGESEAYRTPTQRLLSMGLFEEVNSEHMTVPVSNGREGVLPTTYRRLDVAEGAPDSGSRKTGVSFNHVEASCGGKKPDAGLGHNLMRQLRLCGASPSLYHSIAVSCATKGRESTLTESISPCCSSQTPGSERSRSASECSSIHDDRLTRRTSSCSESPNPHGTRRENNHVSVRTGAGVAISQEHQNEILREGQGRSACDASENGGDSGENIFRGLSRIIKEALRTLSRWQPFAWCEPSYLFRRKFIVVHEPNCE